MPKVVRRQRNFHSHCFTHLRHEISHQAEAFFGNLDAREHMLPGNVLLDAFAGGLRQRSRHIAQQVDPQIHFEPGESFLMALLETLSIDLCII